MEDSLDWQFANFLQQHRRRGWARIIKIPRRRRLPELHGLAFALRLLFDVPRRIQPSD